MEYVVPIKDISKINDMKNILEKSSLRDYLLFVIGINTGLNPQDLLFLKVEDVWNGENIKEFLHIVDTKTGDTKLHYLNNQVYKALNKYVKSNKINQSDYLFKSTRNEKPITRQQAYRIIKSAAVQAGVEGNTGLHTMRKTFGYHAYRKGVAISILMNMFHHNSRQETLKYIGITEEEKNLVKVDVNL
ncbi:tyrosine-type recombinase/integrase [Ornithinibacillus halotolerans]|uniref:Integrase n=1 Tax=Ornithinibacillus halotolerans TaxID=1274357 RepID=A0A916W7K5_9BACI|nr:tyrosine-type recombinase/integrase [Ornithinibacillus halotolerans]GGA72782.1 integrase [Ornithinibacillus halotolerans]